MRRSYAGWFGYYVTSGYTSTAALWLIVSTMPWLMSGSLTLVDVISSPLTGRIGVLAFLGAGGHLMNVTNNLAAYLGAASYLVYILRQPFLVATAWYVLMISVPPVVQFAAIVVISVLLTFTCYEIIRRIPVVRVLFGIAGPRKNIA
ncbi:MAG: hypothetical protein M0R30_04425 [Methanoregula sp.]|uniref:hypothetical protein n=1 Tax=Methanoregula sp. TaxID=2052170 RepID=UPI0025E4874E|nr:hypothetical protein [Methanoregula sp.]MCK9630865.1 hypothetical protein [Methanoregula sp.]